MRMKNKKLIALRLDPDLLGWYRNQGAGYQSRMQEALRQHMLRTDHPLPGEANMARKTPTKQSISSDSEKSAASRGGTDSLAEKFLGSANLTTFPDAAAGEIRLETIRQPLYDTQVQAGIFSLPMSRRDEHISQPPEISFFQDPRGRGQRDTNLATSGGLTWPKRFDVDGVRISISHLVDISEATFSLTVGEKRYLTLPLVNMERDDDLDKDTAAGPLLPRMRFKTPDISPSIHIPPCQHFVARINTGSKYFESAEVRVQLLGELHREIQ